MRRNASNNNIPDDTPGVLDTPIYSNYRTQEISPINISAGCGDADIPGNTNLCLQAAVDYVAMLGGGTVNVLPGSYIMHDSLHLRSNVTVRGSGDDTLLIKAPMVQSRLSVPFLGYGHYDVSLAEPDMFKPGMGIHIGGPGFYGTCATIIFRSGDRFGISRHLNSDCHADAVVRSVFPVISGYGAHDCVVESLKIEGNAEQNGYIDGCRGAGVFLLDCDRAVIRWVTVENYNGDGFSIQQSQSVMIEDCVARRNRGHGFHPGSGSVKIVMRRIEAVENGMDGVFYCLRTTHGILEDSVLRSNGGNGVNIGERDSHNIIRRCEITNNTGKGIFFRPVDDLSLEPVGTTIEDCSVKDNGEDGQ